MRRSAEENPDDCPVEGHLAKVGAPLPGTGLWWAMGVRAVWSSNHHDVHQWDSTDVFFWGM